jgi:hypothetical protein
MTPEIEKPEADVAEQAQPVAGNSAERIRASSDSRGELPLADMVEQSTPITEVQALRSTAIRDEGSEADRAEQSVEVPIDEDEADR